MPTKRVSEKERQRLQWGVKFIKDNLGLKHDHEVAELVGISPDTMSKLMTGNSEKGYASTKTQKKINGIVKELEVKRESDKQAKAYRGELDKEPADGFDHIQRAMKYLEKATVELREAAALTAPLTGHGLQWFADSIDQKNDQYLGTLVDRGK